jgi:negative regulator of sigma-B (phosphoserine phosphatase)
MEADVSATVVNREQCVEWSVASKALPGQVVSGDLHLVSTWKHGVLIAVVDGLGHGDEATLAARTAINVLAEHPGETVVALAQRCHRALQQTRGVVMTLVAIDPENETADMLGIGNVETVLVRGDPAAKPRRESVLLRGGVVGYQLPQLHSSVVPLGRGDIIVFATDGVREDFGDQLETSEPVAQMVDRVMAQKFRGTDDGLVLACKYLGPP